MSATSPLSGQLRKLVNEQDWISVVGMCDQIKAFSGKPQDQAWALHILGNAYWSLARDAFDYANAVLCAREASQLHDLDGLTGKALGIRLVTLGRFDEGSHLLKDWISSRHHWRTAHRQDLCDIQYALGCAARYQVCYAEAGLWYHEAMDGFATVGNQEQAHVTACALAHVYARLGRTQEARSVLRTVPATVHAGYRLKAMTEVLYAEGDAEAALACGNEASEALASLDTDDPWELAELHMLMADLHHRAGEFCERNRHLEVVEHVLRTSPRYGLYAQARLLLGLNAKVAAR